MIVFALVAALGLVVVPAGNWRLAVIMIVRVFERQQQESVTGAGPG